MQFQRVPHNTKKMPRVSGKHNDLEDVGFDTSPHHVRDARETGRLVIILKDAVPWAREFLTEVKIDKTVYNVSI
jgi:alanyl-tRNA synthetase